uniref:hypothetical protein n=1 Tax=Paracoccus sp. SY TaxID=1330255 RepID=UPI0013048756
EHCNDSKCKDAADTIKAQADVIERLQGKLRMIVSHATMGSTDGEGQSTNDICVQITALRNELYHDAKAAEREACAKVIDDRCATLFGDSLDDNPTEGQMVNCAFLIRARGSKEGQS